jgi:hypothetical protein
MQGDFTVKEDGTSLLGPEFRGRGQINDLLLRSANSKVEFAPRSVPFVLTNQTNGFPRPSARQPDARVLTAPDKLHVEFGPFPVALGRPVPAQARGWIGRSGYRIAIRGDGEVSHTLRVASLLGLPAVKASVEGMAQMELQIAGAWAGDVSGSSSGFSLPEVTGTVQLHNVSAAVRGVNGPIKISSAQLVLAHDGARVEKLIAEAADAQWTGTVALPRGCGTPAACLLRFNLNTEEMGMSDLYEWLASQPAQRRWYQILTTTESKAPSFLESLRASGKVNASRLLIHSLIATRVSASLDLEHGKLKISDLRAGLLGGKHRGDWHADFTAVPPVYAGSGSLTAISLQEIADAMHDSWISGTASGTYQVTASGANSSTFWQSADGDLEFDIHDGTLSHIALASDEKPLQITRWQGRALLLGGGKIEIEKGNLVSPAGAYGITGTASSGRLLNLRITLGTDAKAGSSALAYDITGTLAEPHVELTLAPETRAQLKP